MRETRWEFTTSGGVVAAKCSYCKRITHHLKTDLERCAAGCEKRFEKDRAQARKNVKAETMRLF